MKYVVFSTNVNYVDLSHNKLLCDYAFHVVLVAKPKFLYGFCSS